MLALLGAAEYRKVVAVDTRAVQAMTEEAMIACHQKRAMMTVGNMEWGFAVSRWHTAQQMKTDTTQLIMLHSSSTACSCILKPPSAASCGFKGFPLLNKN